MILTAIMLNTFRTRIALEYENEAIPFGRRTVHIELTPDQIEQLKPQHVGVERGKDVYEEFGGCWIEPRNYT